MAGFGWFSTWRIGGDPLPGSTAILFAGSKRALRGRLFVAHGSLAERLNVAATATRWGERARCETREAPPFAAHSLSRPNSAVFIRKHDAAKPEMTDV
jgi:hypothetical protein